MLCPRLRARLYIYLARLRHTLQPGLLGFATDYLSHTCVYIRYHNPPLCPPSFVRPKTVVFIPPDRRTGGGGLGFIDVRGALLFWLNFGRTSVPS